MAIHGECGWLPSAIRRKLEMARLWNRFVLMPNTRVSKHVFKWDKEICRKNWSAEIKKLFADIGLVENFTLCLTVDLNSVKQKLCDTYCYLDICFFIF